MYQVLAMKENAHILDGSYKTLDRWDVLTKNNIDHNKMGNEYVYINSANEVKLTACLDTVTFNPYPTDYPGLVKVDTVLKQVHVCRTRDDLIKQKTTPMKMGRYLKALGYPDDLVRERSNKFTAACEMIENIELLIARTREEIAHVYINGPSSCMSGDDFSNLCAHPSEVYASPDVAVGYVKIGDRIVARTVLDMREDSKGYVEGYGNWVLLEPLLQRAGYGSYSSLEGARLLAISEGDTHIMPYLDGMSRVSESCCGEYFYVDDDGVSATSTCGTLEELAYCEQCEEYVEGDTYYIDHHSMSICGSCQDSDFTYTENHDYVRDSDVVEVNGNSYWEQDDAISEYDGDFYLNEDMVYCEHISEDVPEHLVVQAICDEDMELTYCPKDQTTSVRGVLIWDDFLDEYNEMNPDLLEEVA